jgi:iron complex outermembrane receptor protein
MRSKYKTICKNKYALGRIVMATLLLAAANINVVFAQAGTELVSEAEFFTELSSVDSVTRLPTLKSETPAAVTVIDSDLIRASGARDLADLLRLVPGFQVATPRGHRPAATYHGLGDEFTRRMQILIDGRSVYGALFGHVAWSTLAIALEDIERIEVVRGPNSVTYGANAFLGTINIITRHAAQSYGTAVKFSGGNHDVRDGILRYGTSAGNADIRLTGGYNSGDGLEGLPDDSESTYLNMRTDLHFGERDTLLLQAGISRVNAHEGFDEDRFFPPTQITTDTHFEQIRWHRRLTAENEFAVQLYNDYRKLNYNYLSDPINLGPPLGIVQLPVSFNGTAYRHGVEFQQTLRYWTDWRFVWGTGVYKDEVESLAYFSTSEPVKRRAAQVFGNAEWHVNAATIINLGAMWEDNDYIGSNFSPRLALNYKVGADHTLRVVGSKATRTPSLFEEEGDFRFTFQNLVLDRTHASQGGLQPEIMTSYEAGYLGRFPRINTTLDVRIYRDEMSKLITPVVVPVMDLNDNLAISYSNDADITVEGIDTELSFQPNRDNRITMTLAYMRASANVSGGSALIDRQTLQDSVPGYSGSLLVMRRFLHDWYASIGYYWVDQMLWLDAQDTVDAYRRLDLRIARRFRFGETRGEFAVVVQNAGDRYQDFNPDQYFDQRSFITFDMEF